MSTSVDIKPGDRFEVLPECPAAKNGVLRAGQILTASEVKKDGVYWSAGGYTLRLHRADWYRRLPREAAPADDPVPVGSEWRDDARNRWRVDGPPGKSGLIPNSVWTSDEWHSHTPIGAHFFLNHCTRLDTPAKPEAPKAAAVCGPDLWSQQRKCCPDCNHVAGDCKECGTPYACASPAPAPYQCPNDRPWCKAEKRCGVCRSGADGSANDWRAEWAVNSSDWSKRQRGISPDLRDATRSYDGTWAGRVGTCWRTR